MKSTVTGHETIHHSKLHVHMHRWRASQLRRRHQSPDWHNDAARRGSGEAR